MVLQVQTVVIYGGNRWELLDGWEGAFCMLSLSEWGDTPSEVTLGGKAFGNQRGDFRGEQLWPICRSRALMATTGSRATP